jgi:hypothetical protein
MDGNLRQDGCLVQRQLLHTLTSGLQGLRGVILDDSGHCAAATQLLCLDMHTWHGMGSGNAATDEAAP